MPRLNLTEEEALVITRRREAEAIAKMHYNSAVNAALELLEMFRDGERSWSVDDLVSMVGALRK